MDEEDIAELKEGRTLLDTTEEMDFPIGAQGSIKPTGLENSEQEFVRFQQPPCVCANVNTIALLPQHWKQLCCHHPRTQSVRVF
jgi:hypothetical protein